MPMVSGEMGDDVYVWQREWNSAVSKSVQEHGPSFAHLVVLHAEVSWPRGERSVRRIQLDYETLRSCGAKVGLALRLGAFSGPFDSAGDLTQWLVRVSETLISEAEDAGVRVSEFQLDFDCAESKLDGYRVWVQTIREAISPVPLVITALPSWLDRRSFRYLATASDGYVLQVHSLRRPKTPGDHGALCDPVAARSAISKAGRIGIDFRVALPTYGYSISYDLQGQFVGVSAEVPRSDQIDRAITDKVYADPYEMSLLVNEWKERRPKCMKGIIWFRLPVDGDRLNWPWETLSAVRTGRSPRVDINHRISVSESGLIEVFLENNGETESSVRASMRLTWEGGRLVAGDGLGGYSMSNAGGTAVDFVPDSDVPPIKLRPGARQAIGWLRINELAKASYELSEI